MWIAKLANGQILLPPVLPAVTVKQMLRSKQPLTIVKLVLLVKPVLVELVPLVADKKSCVDCEIGKWSASTSGVATCTACGDGKTNAAVKATTNNCQNCATGKAGTDGTCATCGTGKTNQADFTACKNEEVSAGSTLNTVHRLGAALVAVAVAGLV